MRKIKRKRLLFCFWAIFLLPVYMTVYGQKRNLKGQLIDTTDTPVPFANIIARPVDSLHETLYTISDENGRFRIVLERNLGYRIKITSMGYKPYEFTLDSNTLPSFQIYQMIPQAEKLNTVTLTYELPVKNKNDTLEYNVRSFVKGNELKLKNILKRLPGVVVKNNGEVYVLGKRVTKIFVEGKVFFSGDSKFSIENIPADAVEKIEVLKNFQPVAFETGLEKPEMVLNVRLKEEKKKFIFGDVVAGAGPQNKYLLQPRLFYYAPAHNLSFIGDLNNTGDQNFSMKDLINLQKAGYFVSTKKNRIKPRVHFSEDFLERVLYFGAFQWQQDMGTQASFHTFLIGMNQNTTYQNTVVKQYALIDEPEYTENAISGNESFLTGQIKFEYHPNPRQYLFYTGYISLEAATNFSNQKVVFGNTYKDFTANNTKKIRTGQHLLEWHKKLNRKNIFRFFIYYRPETRGKTNAWESTNPFLTSYLPFQTAQSYTLLQNQWQQPEYTQAEIKYYYRWKPHFHIYFLMGYSGEKARWKNQLTLQNNNPPFSMSNTSYFSEDYKVGPEAKIKWGAFYINPQIRLHYLTRQIKNSPNYNKWYLSPGMKIEAKVLGGEWESSYKYEMVFPSGLYFIPGTIVLNRNQIYTGNPLLLPERMHQISLRYRYYYLPSGITFFTDGEIKWGQNMTIKKMEFLIPPDSQVKDVNVHALQKFYRIGFTFSKNEKNWHLTLSPTLFYADYFALLNDVSQKNNEWVQMYHMDAGYEWKNGPEVETGGMIVQYRLKNSLEMHYMEIMPFLKLNFPYHAWNFMLTYRWKGFINQNPKEPGYHRIETTLRYFPSNKRWGFSIHANNLLNNHAKYFKTLSPYVSVTKTQWTQGLIITFRIHYKI